MKNNSGPGVKYFEESILGLMVILSLQITKQNFDIGSFMTHVTCMAVRTYPYNDILIIRPSCGGQT